MKGKNRLRIALINPKPKAFVYDYPPLGLGYLSAYLKKHGKYQYRIKIVDENVGHRVEEELERFKPELIGITSSTPQIKRAGEVARLVKEKFPDRLLVVGGVHPTIMPEKVLAEYDFDVACFGEGEETFKELVDAYLADRKRLTSGRAKRIRGIAFKKQDAVVVNPARPLIADLDSLSGYDTRLFDEDFYYRLPRPVIIGENRRVGSIITSRGCPYNCVFCSNQTMWRGKVRFHSIDYVLKEIKGLIKRYHTGTIIFQDDLFMASKDRVREFCRALIREKLPDKIIWGCQGRANLLNRHDLDLLKLMKRAGCVQLAYGFESGSERILKYLKGNTVTVAQNQKALDLTKKAGLKTMGYFMLGTQGETEKDLLKTKAFILKNKDKLDHYQMYITTPFPGTQIWDICEKEGLVKGIDWEQYGVGILDKHVFTNTVAEKKILDLYDDLTYLTISRTSFKEKLKWLLSNLRSNPKFTFERMSFYLKKKFKTRNRPKV